MNELVPQIDVCYVISHGFAARMVLQTGLLIRLADAGKQVAVIAPDASDENLRDVGQHPRIHVFNAGLKQTIWDDDYTVKRMYFLEDLRANPVFWEKHIYSIRYTKSKHPWKRVRPFIYYGIHRLIKYFPSIQARFRKTEHRNLVSNTAEDLLQQLQPYLVVATYPINFIEAKYLYAAKSLGYETMIHLLSWDNITSKGIFPVIPDRFILWGDIMYQELKDYYGTPDTKVAVCGVPHFDHHLTIKEQPSYKALLKELGLDPERPYFFLAMSSPRFAPYEIDIVEWLAEQVNRNVFGDEMQFVVRPHPQNVQGSMADQRWLGRLQAIKGPRVGVDIPKLVDSKVRYSMKATDMDHLSNLLVGCTLSLNSGSTVSIDSLVMGK
ncbi:MAG: hypothetical protein AAFU67_16510, partial [Bacteroidota bacterium]